MRNYLLCIIVSVTFTNLSISQEKLTDYSFYGKEFSCDINLISAVDTVEIISFWNSLKKHDEQIINGFFRKKEEFNLNDWGFYMLLKSTMKQSINNDQLANIATCYYLNRAGYRSKIALSHNNNILLLLHSADLMLSADVVNDGKYTYYVLGNENADRLSVLEMDYNEDGKGFNLNFDVPLNLSGVTVERQLKFWHKCRRHIITISLDSSLIAFYNEYPQLELDQYFMTPLSATLEESLYNELADAMLEMTETEKVNYLLSFCQKAFKHKKDIKAYGKSRSLFSEETIYYPISDCEDRAILFANLIQLFTDLPIIGLCYPKHVLTAIAIEDDKPNLLFNKSLDTPDGRYFYADPTYARFKIGFVMPKYTRRTPRIIEIEK